MKEFIPEAKALYRISGAFGQHEPGMKMLKFFSTGVHCTQLKRRLRPRITLIVIMANQTTHLTQLLEIRSRVRANEVLLMAAASIENTPDISKANNIRGVSRGSMS